MNTKFTWQIVLVLLLASLFYVINIYVPERGTTQLVPGQDVVIEGRIAAVSLEQAMYDGPYLITLQTKENASVVVAIPSMGLPLCPAYEAKNIGDVTLFEVGQEIEVHGEVGEDGRVVPCTKVSHFIRPAPIVVNDFEGEADPSVMRLNMKSWEWVATVYEDGRKVIPRKVGVFSITFTPGDNRFSVKTDCNSMGGSYAIKKSGEITLGDMYSTEMYCEGSQEFEFSQALQEVARYEFTSRGELLLHLEANSGTMTLR